MTVSDIIILITLIIAIIAIINEKDRKHILLKYSRLDVLLFGLGFFFINYFVYYSSFKSRDWVVKLFYSENYGLRNPNNWAYIISVCILLYIIYKIYYSFFPFRNIRKVENLYKSQIEKGEFTFLLDLIEKYHKRDILVLINRKTNESPGIFDWEMDKPSFFENMKGKYKDVIRNLSPKSSTNRQSYASCVFHNIINDAGFIHFVSHKSPYFFSSFIARLTKENRSNYPSTLCNNYFEQLIESKNYWLVKELRESSDNDYGQPDWFFNSNRILASVLNDLSVADVNEVWQPFGEVAINEIEEDRGVGMNSFLMKSYRDDEVLWNSKAFLSIQFFKIMVLEAIKKNYGGCHFFLHYNAYFIDAFLKNLEIVEDNADRNIHHLIKIITDNTFLWLKYYCQLDRSVEQLNGYEPNGRFHDIIGCIGTIIYYLTGSGQYTDESKIELLDKALRFYCNMEEKSQTQEIKAKLEEILVRPSMLWNDNHPYHGYLNVAWQKFDKVPHRNHISGEDFQYFKDLKEKVLMHCGIDPDA